MAKRVLKDVRLAFPVLFTAEEFQPGDGKPRYSAVLLIPKGGEQDKAIKADIDAAAKEAYGDKWQKMVKSFEGSSNKNCYQDGDNNPKDYDGYAGNMSLSAHRRAKDGPVGVYDRDKTPLSESSGKPYAGCYVNASVEIWCQKGEFPGIRCSLIGVQFLRDGDAFSGTGRANADDFESLGEPEEDLV